jgi:predicted transcriptional regulator
MRHAAKLVIDAMRVARHLNKEITTHNIAAILGVKVQTVGANLQKMVKEGLVRRHDMLWRINTVYVRKLEEESGDIENKKAAGSTRKVQQLPRGKATKRVSHNEVRDAQ